MEADEEKSETKGTAGARGHVATQEEIDQTCKRVRQAAEQIKEITANLPPVMTHCDVDRAVKSVAQMTVQMTEALTRVDQVVDVISDALDQAVAGPSTSGPPEDIPDGPPAATASVGSAASQMTAEVLRLCEAAFVSETKEGPKERGFSAEAATSLLADDIAPASQDPNPLPTKEEAEEMDRALLLKKGKAARKKRRT